MAEHLLTEVFDLVFWKISDAEKIREARDLEGITSADRESVLSVDSVY